MQCYSGDWSSERAVLPVCPQQPRRRPASERSWSAGPRRLDHGTRAVLPVEYWERPVLAARPEYFFLRTSWRGRRAVRELGDNPVAAVRAASDRVLATVASAPDGALVAPPSANSCSLPICVLDSRARAPRLGCRDRCRRCVGQVWRLARGTGGKQRPRPGGCARPQRARHIAARALTVSA